MGFTEAQQYKISILLGTEFKETYDLIPEEFKKNYFFQKFLYKLAEMKFTFDTNESNEFENIILDFDVNKTDDETKTKINFLIYSLDNSLRKISTDVILTNENTLSFLYVSSYNHNKNYISMEDVVTHKLDLRLSEDKSVIFVDYLIQNKNKFPIESSMSSTFNIDGNEIQRKTNSIETETNFVLFDEEITTAELEIDDKNYYFKKFYPNEEKYLDENQDLYLIKSDREGETKYAIFCKLKKYINKAYEKSFEQVSSFNKEGDTLFETLDCNLNSYVVEISEEDYNEIIKEQIKIRIKNIK